MQVAVGVLERVEGRAQSFGKAHQTCQYAAPRALFPGADRARREEALRIQARLHVAERAAGVE